MLEKPYIIRGNNWCGASIVKITYGKKFCIAKCKTQAGTLKNIEDGLNAFIRGGHNNPNGIYHHLYNYVKRNPNNEFQVVTLLESDSGYELLKREQQELETNRRNPNFLNNQIDAYIPQFDEVTGLYGWLKKADVMNFKKYLNK